MAEQIRLVLTVDEAVKKLIEDSAAEFCEGNSSAYVRGLVVLHQLLLGKPTGKADYPGWMLEQFPIPKIDNMRGSLAESADVAARAIRGISTKKTRFSRVPVEIAEKVRQEHRSKPK